MTALLDFAGAPAAAIDLTATEPILSEPAGAIDGGSERGVVAVHLLGVGNATASCSCGWAGRRRLLKAVAQQDAWAHSMQDRCDVSSPMVLPW
jgi:hypothetical protein